MAIKKYRVCTTAAQEHLKEFVIEMFSSATDADAMAKARGFCLRARNNPDNCNIRIEEIKQEQHS